MPWEQCVLCFVLLCPKTSQKILQLDEALYQQVPTVEFINPGAETVVYRDFPKHPCVELLNPKGSLTSTIYLHLCLQAVFKKHKSLSAGRMFL